MTEALKSLQALLPNHDLDAYLVAAPETLSSVNLRYLTGFTGSSAYLVIGREQAWLLTDFRYVEQAAAECSGLEVVQHQRQVSLTLKELVVRHQLWRLGFEGDRVPVDTLHAWQRIVPAVWTSVPGLIDHLRLKKRPDEIAKIREAARIAGQAVTEVLPALRAAANIRSQLLGQGAPDRIN